MYLQWADVNTAWKLYQQKAIIRVRTISCRLGLYDRPNRSAYIEMGNAKVFATVYGPREVASINSSLTMYKMIQIAVSQGGHLRHPTDKRTRAMNQHITGVFHTARRKSKYPDSLIEIYLQVLQADGGVMSACISTSTLALQAMKASQGHKFP
ncbi:exosome complex component RRP41-like [Penaeus japonicus]|uniref:exosome complex component RRP41-like n=1 Tax=Penaeus japonicus TaxID=27405 RepID=UPI001C70B389|nr:exosome complex component RRP41-like [Penaeus japonicus]